MSGNLGGFTNAAEYGFSPDESGVRNAAALQRAVDRGGTIVVTHPGTYRIAATVYIGSNTSLIFANGVFLRKEPELGPFTHVLLNRGALTRTCDENITVEGLHIVVNEVDVREFQVYGLHGQIAFLRVRDLRIERYRCLDLGPLQYGIHICTFEDIVVEDVVIKGKKDGVHLGRGRRFTIRDCVFQTFDDAIALNGHDYATGNPELGWIENGVVENCHDLNAADTTGFFCRILAGGWTDWCSGMEVQQSDSVVSNGRVYRVQAKPDGTVYRSLTQPTHENGSRVLDGICWGVVQHDATHTAGVRNVVFRDIFLEKPRVGFSIHFDNDRFSRSYYPGAPVPVQENIILENVRILHSHDTPLAAIGTPLDTLAVFRSSIRSNPIRFHANGAMGDYLRTTVSLCGCTFGHGGSMALVTNTIKGKHIVLKTTATAATHPAFTASVQPGGGRIDVDSDLPGLRA